MTFKKTALFILIVIVVALVVHALISTPTANACGFFSSCANDTTEQKKVEQVSVTEQVNRLVNASPIPKLESSLERDNISKRLKLFSDPAKISYIYLTSYGRVMAFYTVKGKITSGNKRLTSPDQLVDDSYYESGQHVVQAPELDGAYGSSADYIYFWTTDGTYVQWNGEYMLADQPLKLSTQPELVRAIK